MRRLTKKFCDQVSKPGRFGDGLGLHLFVTKAGTKSWVQRLTVRGTRVDRGLGSYPAISLTTARDSAIENWRETRRGGDPWSDRMEARRTWARETATVPTLAEATEAVLELRADHFKNQRTLADWGSTFARYLFPTMGDEPVSKITTGDILLAIEPVWREKRETGKRLRQRLSQVMLWCVAHGYRTDDPAGAALTAVLPRNGVKHHHHEAVPHRQVGATLAGLRASRVYLGVAHCIEFLAHCAVRSREARGARWEEVDLDAATWSIPSERMKGGAVHVVPLTERALAILAEARRLGDGIGLIFPSATGKEIRDAVLLRGLKVSGCNASIHGFRSSFRDWCGETGQPREVAEMALSHQIGNAVENAYARSSLLERRRALMTAWSRYLVQDEAR